MVMTDVPEAKAERTHWAVVQACLVQLHGWTPHQAARAVAELRKRLRTTTNPMAAEIVYHAEPFDIACDLAQNSLNFFEHRAEYDAIISQQLHQTSQADALTRAERHILPPRGETQERYRQYIRKLSSEEAGRLELGPADKPITERARLKAAAKAEGVNLRLQRRGNTIVFWRTDEPPEARRGDGGRRGQRMS
jgi:hypothetical protein